MSGNYSLSLKRQPNNMTTFTYVSLLGPRARQKHYLCLLILACARADPDSNAVGCLAEPQT